MIITFKVVWYKLDVRIHRDYKELVQQTVKNS